MPNRYSEMENQLLKSTLLMFMWNIEYYIPWEKVKAIPQDLLLITSQIEFKICS